MASAVSAKRLSALAVCNIVLITLLSKAALKASSLGRGSVSQTGSPCANMGALAQWPLCTAIGCVKNSLVVAPLNLCRDSDNSW